MKLFVETVEKVDYTVSELIFEVELFAQQNMLSGLQKVGGFLVDSLHEVGGGSFEQKDLVVVVSVV